MNPHFVKLLVLLGAVLFCQSQDIYIQLESGLQAALEKALADLESNAQDIDIVFSSVGSVFISNLTNIMDGIMSTGGLVHLDTKAISLSITDSIQKALTAAAKSSTQFEYLDVSKITSDVQSSLDKIFGDIDDVNNVDVSELTVTITNSVLNPIRYALYDITGTQYSFTIQVDTVPATTTDATFCCIGSVISTATAAAPVPTSSQVSSGVYDSRDSTDYYVGLTVGGAMDVENFRESIQQNFLPSPLDITPQGIFNEYYFDTSSTRDNTTCQQLFCPAYSVAVTMDPVQQTLTDLYLAVGLDSGASLSDILRKTLNLVVVLDISGSMDSQMVPQNGFTDQYYDTSLTKFDAAKISITNMLDQLNNNDSFGLVVFDDFGEITVELTKIEDLNLQDIRSQILNIQLGGGTNLESGYITATNVLKQCSYCLESGLKHQENRIILLTDAQPNLGDISAFGLSSLVQKNAGIFIFTSILGIGLDFNTELSEILTKTRGANYFIVNDPEEFQLKLVKQFEFMVTPLVFDVKLEIDAESFDDGRGWKVIKVYGSPDIDGGLDKEGVFVEINTLFPSPKSVTQGIKGGVVLLKMQNPDSKIPLKLKVSYRDRDTLKKFEVISEVDEFFNSPNDEYFDSTGVQKAVLLARYVDILRGWLIDQYSQNNNSDTSSKANQNSNYNAFVASSGSLVLQQEEQGNTNYNPNYQNQGQYLQKNTVNDFSSGASTKKSSVQVSKSFCEYYPQDRIIEQNNAGCLVEQFVKPKSQILPVYDSVLQQNQESWGKLFLPLSVSQEQGEVMKKFLVYFQDTVDELQDESLEQEVGVLVKLIDVSGYV